MSEKSTYSHPQLGSITINRSARATRISISISRKGDIKLTLPLNANIDKALDFLNTKVEWIESARIRVANRAAKTPKFIEPPLSTKFHSLRLEALETAQIAARITAQQIVVSYPMELSHHDPRVQQIIFKALEHTCRLEAESYLPQRVKQLAEYCKNIAPQYKWQFGRVSVRRARTRWGSCAGGNNISLNISLMMLADHLIDYIILHELAHTVHKNHGKEFHALLDKLAAGQHAKLAKELKGLSPLEPPSPHHQ